jgi:hypothetical protein
MGHNKCKEILPTKLQYKVDKNPTWPRSWMLLDALLYYKEGSFGLPLKNVMIVFQDQDLGKICFIC